jgi:F-type H+-transporting ATPase subunit b
MQTRIWNFILTLAVFASPAIALAADEGDHSKPALLTFDPGAAIWTILVFIGLLVLLRATAWKPILKGLQDREKFISDALISAKAEREKAEALLKQYTVQIEKARVEATAIVEEGKRDADVVRKRVEQEARESAEQMLDRAKREIAIAKDDAIKDLYERTLDLCADVASKIIGRSVSAEDHRALLDESIAELSKSRA